MQTECTQFSYDIDELILSSFKRFSDDGMGTPVPDCTKRVGPALRIDRNDHAAGGMLDRGVYQIAEPAGLEAGLITGDDQAPLGRGVAQRGFDAAKRPATGKLLAKNGHSEVLVALRVPHERDTLRCGQNLLRDGFHEGPAPEGECGFVEPHAAAQAAGKDKTRDRHYSILAIRVRNSGIFPGTQTFMRGYNRNIVSVICSIGAAGLMLAATARPARTETLPGVRSVVRADAKTGRLVRRVVGPPQTPAAKVDVSQKLDRIVKETAHKHEVDPLLVHSVIQVESGYDPYAVSPKGARGLMQLIPATASRFGVADAFDARANIEGGVKYLKYLKGLFKDDRLALAAYNAGEGAVLRYKGIPPYRETQDYVDRVGRKYGEARKKNVAETPAPAAPEGPVAEPVRSLSVETDAEGRLFLRTR